MAPGIPSIPTKIAVNMFKPMWKLNIVPIQFATNIIPPPSIELKTNLSICFIGIISTFPNISIAKIHDKKIIIVLVLSIGLSSILLIL